VLIRVKFLSYKNPLFCIFSSNHFRMLNKAALALCYSIDSRRVPPNIPRGEGVHLDLRLMRLPGRSSGSTCVAMRRIYRMFAKESDCRVYAELGCVAGYKRLQLRRHFEAERARDCLVSQTVFVLEDDADILRLVQFHLEAAGYTVRRIWRWVRSWPTRNGSHRHCFYWTLWFRRGWA